MNQQKFKIISLTLVFVLLISFPLINNICGIIKDSKNLENRALARKPVLDINLLDPFPGEYEKYYNDYFSLRSLIVKCFTNYNLRVFKKSPFPDRVIIGNNGWLYLAGNELKCYLGTNRLTNEQLEAYKRDLEFQKKYLEERGCKFYFMVTPTKANVHSENVPYSYFRFNKESIGEQLTNYLKKNSSINVISVFDSFQKIKENNQLYFKLDNHWNQKGAFYAANIVSSQIAKDFPSVKPLLISDFSINEFKKKEEGDIGNMLGSPNFYEDIKYEFISKKTHKPLSFDPMNYALPHIRMRDTKDNKKPKLMLISDSFSNQFFPFISESFDKSLNVFDGWQYRLQDELINQEKPNVYLLMVYEPFLMFVPDNQSRFKK